MVLTISVAIIAASVLAVACFLVPRIIQIGRTIRELKRLISAVSRQVDPVSQNLSRVCQETTFFLQSLRRQTDKVEKGITTLQDVTVRFREFQEEIQGSIKGPLIEFVTLLGAMGRVTEAFTRIFRR
jgi:uncharacterized protein YoxC